MFLLYQYWDWCTALNADVNYYNFLDLERVQSCLNSGIFSVYNLVQFLVHAKVNDNHVLWDGTFNYRPYSGNIGQHYIFILFHQTLVAKDTQTHTHTYTNTYKYTHANNIYTHTTIYVEGQTYTISFTRQVQTKLNFKLLHALGPQDTGQVETKVLLTMFKCINSACFE